MFSMHLDTARTWRGGQNQVLLTVLGLRASGHRAMLVAHPEGELRRRASEGTDVIGLAPRTEMDLSAGWRLSRVIRREAPSILHAHDPHAVAMAGLAVSLDPRGPQPVLVASRRVDFRLKDHAFSKWKYRQVRMFICASEAIRQLLVAGGIEEARTVTVHEGIDISHVDAATRVDVHSDFWLPHGAPIVGNIAALVPHKGQHDLVEAAALVVRELPDARFLVVGEGELRSALERRIQELHLQKHVLLTGFRPDALGLLKGFDLFVMSSVNEGLGTSLLDAMACEKPVVATSVGGIPEVVAHGETGLLVPPRAPREMAAAILRLLRNARERQVFARAGRTRVLARFTVERMVRETAAVYERLAGTGRAAGTARRGRNAGTRTDPASPGDTARSRTLWDPPDRDG
jgi:glycosyltransferase involved in cell wall biosynthesis